MTESENRYLNFDKPATPRDQQPIEFVASAMAIRIMASEAEYVVDAVETYGRAMQAPIEGTYMEVPVSDQGPDVAGPQLYVFDACTLTEALRHRFNESKGAARTHASLLLGLSSLAAASQQKHSEEVGARLDKGELWGAKRSPASS